MIFPAEEELDTIIMLDSDGNSMYEYEVDRYFNGTRLEKINFLSQNNPELIYLPLIDGNNDRALTEKEVYDIYSNPSAAEKYITGSLILGSGLFKDLDNVTIAVSQHKPIIIEENCFKEGCTYNFVLPENMTILEVNKTHKFSPELFPRKYLMIGDKRVFLNYIDEMEFDTTVTHYQNVSSINMPHLLVDENRICQDGEIITRLPNQIDL